MKNSLLYLAEKPRANEEDAAVIIRQLLDALKYLHNKSVVHLDIRVGIVSINTCFKNNFKPKKSGVKCFK